MVISNNSYNGIHQSTSITMLPPYCFFVRVARISRPTVQIHFEISLYVCSSDPIWPWFSALKDCFEPLLSHFFSALISSALLLIGVSCFGPEARIHFLLYSSHIIFQGGPRLQIT